MFFGSAKQFRVLDQMQISWHNFSLIIGPEIFKDDCVSQCINRILHEYLIPKAHSGHLCLVLKGSVAGLDAFEPL